MSKIKALIPFFPLIIMILAGIGLLDATYLAFNYFTAGDIKCVITSGCDVVASSSYAVWFGFIPVSLGGVFFYFVTFLLAFLIKESNQFIFKTSLLIWSIVAVLISMWLTFVQAFILDAYCFYCLISAGLSLFIFGLALGLWQEVKIKEKI